METSAFGIYFFTALEKLNFSFKQVSITTKIFGTLSHRALLTMKISTIIKH